MSSQAAPDAEARFAAARAALAAAWLHPALPVDDNPDLVTLVDDVLKAHRPDERLRSTWLLLVALTGALPTLHQLEDARLTLSAAGPAELVGTAVASEVGPARGHLSTRRGGTFVDVTVTAGTANLAGVPRVVRQLVQSWGEPAGVHYVVWDEHALRTLDDGERERLGLPSTPDGLPPGSWVVPYDATLVVLEVLRPEAHAQAVEAMAHAGVIDLRGLVYDLASLVETHPDAARGPFLHHLSALSRASRVSAISKAVAADVGDYFSVFSRNGRHCPALAGHVLPEDPGWQGEIDPEVVASLAARLRGDPRWPLVTVVSSLHRRKNHARFLAVCEQLWNEGLPFRVLAIEGTGSRLPAVAAATDRLIEQGRPLTLLSRLSEAELRAAYGSAHVSVYASLAEGYGLPIVESLAAGTPVITSAHGSMAEVAEGGGVLTVDPRDEDALAEALRSVLTDTALHDRLLRALSARPQSTWPDYAHTLGAYFGILQEGQLVTSGLDAHVGDPRSGRTA